MLHLGLGSLLTMLAGAEEARMVSTSKLVYSLERSNFQTGSGVEVVMKYDLEMDPIEKNGINMWNVGFDVYGKTAYDYTRWDGPLGIYGPLGPFGPLGSGGALPFRYVGSIPESDQLSYWNNWCTADPNERDENCVYGSFGPLGESGPLGEYQYYYEMYHLEEETYWYNDYNINLDASGIWGIQGPLGTSGALGVLGALGPLGISLQVGVATSSNGVYSVKDDSNCYITIRKTQLIRYDHGATMFREYELFEMYSREYALSMTSDPISGNDCSFAVDASTALLSNTVVTDGKDTSVKDTFHFHSSGDQFLTLLLVPFGGENLKQSSMPPINLSMTLSCNSSFISDAELQISPSNIQNGLSPYITTRAFNGEFCQVDVHATVRTCDVAEASRDRSWTGYYLFVTGSGLTVSDQKKGVTDTNPDIWGMRKQSNGARSFNINGPHQRWVPMLLQ